MTGSDILVVIMGVIAVGFGVICFFSEWVHGKEDENAVQQKENREQ